jgi:hypothetical protein
MNSFNHDNVDDVSNWQLGRKIKTHRIISSDTRISLNASPRPITVEREVNDSVSSIYLPSIRRRISIKI